MRRAALCLIALLLAAFVPAPAKAELLAAMNYESKPGGAPRKEGIAVIDIDPASKSFNTIVRNVELPADLVAHHIYFNRDATKAYVTMLGRSVIGVYDLATFPDRGRFAPVPDCKVGEDMVFSADRKRWFLSCMGSSNIIMGDAETDETLAVIAAPEPKPGETMRAFIKHPHGVTIHDELDLVIATSTVNPADMTQGGETISMIRASTGELLATQKVTEKPSPSGVAPVETFFLPGHTPPIAYITNMGDGTLGMAVWQPEKMNFRIVEAFDFAPVGQSVPLEIDADGDRLFVTTAKPGAFNIFDIAEPRQPKLLVSIPTAAGAHHFVFSPDRRYVFVQNSLLNLDGMNDGAVSVIDLSRLKVVGEIDVLKKAGFNPNCIILMPQSRRDEG